MTRWKKEKKNFVSTQKFSNSNLDCKLLHGCRDETEERCIDLMNSTNCAVRDSSPNKMF